VKLIQAKDAARLVGVSRETIFYWIRTGRLKKYPYPLSQRSKEIYKRTTGVRYFLLSEDEVLKTGREMEQLRNRKKLEPVCCDDYKLFACLDCETCTNCTGEYYMVHDHVWLSANPRDHGMLCIWCLERRLGRVLTKDDFTAAPVNSIWGQFGSTRLKNRLLTN